MAAAASPVGTTLAVEGFRVQGFFFFSSNLIKKFGRQWTI